jgi:hypothetical protein
LYWQIGTIEGLHRIGGAGAWSDAMYRLTDQLQRHPLGTIKLLDWGLQDNFYVLSDGRIPMREIFPTGAHRPWIDEIRDGGAFVLNGPANRQFPAASEEFLRALAETRPVAKRQRFTQRDGVVAMELIEIEPNTIGAAPTHQHSIIRISMEDAARLDGFYGVENGTRWTKREFAITFGLAGDAGDAPVLAVQLYIPDALIQKLGPITLSARLGDHRFEPETYRQSGQYTFKREFNVDWLASGTNRFEFVLDKALPPTPADRRELGVVVLSASLEM